MHSIFQCMINLASPTPTLESVNSLSFLGRSRTVASFHPIPINLTRHNSKSCIYVIRIRIICHRRRLCAWDVHSRRQITKLQAKAETLVSSCSFGLCETSSLTPRKLQLLIARRQSNPWCYIGLVLVPLFRVVMAGERYLSSHRHARLPISAHPIPSHPVPSQC
jgi:hypothetical protein